MEGKVTVVGTGPGHPAYLTHIAAAKIAEATVLVGGRRLLETFAREGQQKYPVDRDLHGVLAYIKSHYQKEKLVVLVSGDTGIYSLASYLAGKLPAESLEFIPGVSSVQLMFAKIKRPWHDASIISLHGRNPAGLAQMVQAGRKVAVLTDDKHTPRAVAAHLLGQGCSDRSAAVGTNLSYPGEKIIEARLSILASGPENRSPAVMVINYE